MIPVRKSYRIHKRNRRLRARSRTRAGSLMVWCAFLMVVLIGMVGLVIDGGLLLAAYRHSQNAADAAALATVMAKLRGFSEAEAKADGAIFVTSAAHNKDKTLAGVTVTINLPPTQGPYAGNEQYAEAFVVTPTPTYFIHVLPGFVPDGSVTARAVAGYELVAAGEGVITLDAGAWPGLKITGDAQLVVHGDIYVNSEGAGVDEDGNPVDNGNHQTAMMVSPNAGVYAENINVVGGVNDPGNFYDIDGGDNPLDANTTGISDPLLYLDTPDANNGVMNVQRGAPQASDGTLALNNPNDDSGSPNYIEVDPITGEETMMLQPGVYETIKVTGGKVIFAPGIYVLSPQSNVAFSLEITGGDVTAEGIMFYNTGSDYNVLDGTPDSGDLDQPPAAPSDVIFGKIKINASMQFSPIDTETYTYDPSVSTDFENMLFYQRRWNDAGMQIEGNSDEGDLAGTLYAKWAEVKIAGQGTYDAQFVVGSMDLSGQGDITINYNGDNVGKAPRIFLVE